MSALPREIVRWLQTLDLPQQVRNPKRDLSNGYLAAEICARYWTNVDLRQFDNGTSSRVKQGNWKALSKAMAKNGASLPDALIQDVIVAKDAAGRQLLEALYSMFTNRVVQQCAPLDAPEIAQIPTFVKPTRQNDSQQMFAQQQQQQQQQQQMSMMQQLEEEQAALEREAAAEAERRRQQKLSATAAAAKKAKAPATVQAIKAMDETEGGEDQPKLQFSGVTVKPLSGQALARLGVGRGAGTQRRSASGAASSAADGGRGGPAAVAGDGVLTSLSHAIEAMLRDSGGASWPVPPGMTHVEYFAQSHQRLPPPARDAVWGTLFAAVDDTAAWLAARPADTGAFAAAFLPAVSTDAVQTILGRAHFPFTGLDLANSTAYAMTVFAAMAKRRPAYAAAALTRSVLPLVAPAFVACSADERRADAARLADCVDAMAALAGCCVESQAESRTRQFLSTLHEALVASAVARDANANAVAGLLAFLRAVDAVCGLPSSCQARHRQPGRADGGVSNGAVVDGDDDDEAPEGSSTRTSPLRCGADGHAAEQSSSEATSAAVLHDGVAAAVSYHATAAVHHASSSVRVLGLRLLTRLARSGHVASVLPRHIAVLTGLTDTAALQHTASAAHPEAVSQCLALLRHSIAAVGARLNRYAAEGADDAEGEAAVGEMQAVDETLTQVAVALAAAGPNGGPSAFFTWCRLSDKISFLIELGAAAEHLGTDAADGSPSAQQVVVHGLMQALFALPQPLQQLVTRATAETIPDAAALRGFGVFSRSLSSSREVHGAPDVWPALPVVSMLVQMIAASDFTPPALPNAAKAGKVKVPASDAEDAEALQSGVGRLLELLFQFVVRRKGRLCEERHVAAGWDVMRLAWPPLQKGVRYHEQLVYLRGKGVPVPRDSAAHAAMVPLARQCRAIVLRFFAEWSGVPQAGSLARPSLTPLVDGIHSALSEGNTGDADDADTPRPGSDRVLDWWTTTVQPAPAPA